MLIIKKKLQLPQFFPPPVTAIDVDDIMFPRENDTEKTPIKYPNGASVTHHIMRIICVSAALFCGE